MVFALMCAAPARAAEAGDAIEAAMRGRMVPAMGIAVLREDHIAALAVRGVRVMGGHDAVLPTDRWHIGSDAKAMTAVLIGRLVERGLLRWDDRLEQILPDLALGMAQQYRRATLAELLSHRAGLPHDVVDPEARAALFGDDAADGPAAKRLRYVVRALADAPVGRRGRYAYSNTDYLIAAVVAERVGGATWEDLLRREVTGPLGMDRVGYGTTGPGEPQGHREGRVRAADDTNPPFFAPAGAVVLPLADWAAFCLDQLAGAQGRGKLLSAENYRRMQRPAGEGGYGFGWQVADGFGGHPGPVLLHTGSDTNWYAMAVLVPREGTGVIAVANAGPDMGGEAAVRAAVDAVLAP